jgi:hypothetical protein
MVEKAYKSMSRVGALNITVGIVVLVLGVVSGVLLIIGGGRLHRINQRLCFNSK